MNMGSPRHREDGSGVRQRSFAGNILSSGDVDCGCCLDRMDQPVTLTCGHSFCRLCIERWYLTSMDKNCPECRIPCRDIPNVNITLRNLLQRMHTESVSEREREDVREETRVNNARIMSASNTIRFRQTQVQNVYRGIIPVFATFGLIFLAWCLFWRSSDQKQDIKVHKPLTNWTNADVKLWLTDMGSWAYSYSQALDDKNKGDAPITVIFSPGGRLVLGFDEDTLISSFNITDSLHRKTLLNAIRIVQNNGMKATSNLWEINAMYPGWALFLVYGLGNYPRSCLLYLYMFEYETIFLPFVHVISPVSENASRYDFTYTPPGLTLLQWAEFLPKFVLLPYYLIWEFTWDWLVVHWLTTMFIVIICCVLTVLEAYYFIRFFERQDYIDNRSMSAEQQEILKRYLTMVMFFLIWRIVPSFVLDCLFFMAMCFSPYQVCEKIYDAWRIYRIYHDFSLEINFS